MEWVWTWVSEWRSGVILERGEVLQQFQDFREKFWSIFWITLYILYIFTSPSAQDREVSQLREAFSPTSPPTMTPDRCMYNYHCMSIPSVRMKNGFSSISFKINSLLESNFMHRHIIIKSRTSSIYG